MIKSVDYSVTFGTTGRTLKEKVNFQAGFGTITGPNESGKSFVVEMIRWALFGSAALRGKTSDYKKAKATLKIAIKGENYTIERTLTNAKMLRDDVEIAVGTTPVNAKVVQVMGFGMAVFDASCVANQGDLEVLGSMKPTERKRLVDSVIGLGVLDDLAKSAAEESRASKRLASDLSATVREPQPPVIPEGHRPLSEIDVDLAAMSEAKTRVSIIKSKLIPLQEPTVPEEKVAVPSTVLQGMYDTLEQSKAAVRRLELELSTLPSPSTYSEATLDALNHQHWAYDRWVQRDTLERVRPLYTRERIQEMFDQHDENELFERAQHLRKKLGDLNAKGTHTCPACSHEWAVEQSSINTIEDELLEVLGHEHVDVPWSRADLNKHLQTLEAWDEDAWNKVKMAEKTAKPALTIQEIERERNKNSFMDQRDDLQTQLVSAKRATEGKPDYAAMLKTRLAYEQAMEGHATRMLEYQEKVAEQEALAAEQESLLEAVKGFDALSQLRTDVIVYDTLQSRYGEDVTRYTEVMANVLGMENEAEQWDKAKEALTNLRGLIKQHLMPSLNKVSSHYLSQMTDGQRQVIYTDEEFNITVDGQPLNTLSGSGKAVACLALRLGLGQVLTNNVLSLFVGDEIDASMDENRSNSTSLTLQTLKNRVSQILLVTHKYPTADYYITVGRTNEPEDTES